MKTTVELDDGLLAQSKEAALNDGVTLKALVEEGLRHVLARRQRHESSGLDKIQLPVCSQGGGLLPGVNLNDSADLEDRMGE